MNSWLRSSGSLPDARNTSICARGPVGSKLRFSWIVGSSRLSFSVQVNDCRLTYLLGRRIEVAMGTERRRLKVRIRQRPAAHQTGQAVLEIGQVAGWQQADRRQSLEAGESLVRREPCLSPIVVRAEPGPRVEVGVGLHVARFQAGEKLGDLLTEGRGVPFGRRASISSNLVA